MLISTWLKQILRGEKKLLNAKDARHCNPSKFAEISVKNLYEKCLQLEGMADYFPNHYPKGRSCDRSYFFTVLASLYPDYVEKLLL